MYAIGESVLIRVCFVLLLLQGNDVTMYGLAVEHTVQDLVVWAGARGRTYFYQSELPYDADQVTLRVTFVTP